MTNTKRLSVSVFIFLFAFHICLSSNDAFSHQKKEYNQQTVGLISGSLGGVYVKIASSLSKVFDNTSILRVVPIIGKGSIKNVDDILHLEGVDLAIVQSDVLYYYAENQENAHPNISNALYYIAKLYDEEIHLIARRDIKIDGVENNINGMLDLNNNHIVGVGPPEGGTHLTVNNIIAEIERSSGKKIQFQRNTDDYVDAIEKLKNGELSAVFYVVGKGADQIKNANQSKDAYKKHLRLVPMPVDMIDSQYYSEVKINKSEYNNMVDEESISTLSVSAILMAYNWDWTNNELSREEGKNKIKNFTERFFEKLSSIQARAKKGEPDFPEQWGYVDPDAAVSCWRRLPAARAFLQANSFQIEPDKPC